MIDVQSTTDVRNVKIKKVGVKGIRHPFVWKVDSSTQCQTVGQFNLFVELAAEQKGTHMSRFLDVLYRHVNILDEQKLIDLALDVKKNLESPSAFIEVNFTYFYQKHAPISKKAGLFEVEVLFNVAIDEQNRPTVLCQVDVPVQSLCPCSKAISEFGAHNQRSLMSLKTFGGGASLEQLIAVAENAASSALYPVLKRVDEKYITEKAFENPKFVEDLVRDAAIGLKSLKNVDKFEVSAENFESIHSHNVWAIVQSSDM